MPLTSLRLLVLCIAVAVSVPLLLGVLWLRTSRSSRWTLAVLLVGVLVGQGAAVAVVALHVNRTYGFYPSWSSLFGTDLAPPVVMPAKGLGIRTQVSRGRALPLSLSAPENDRFTRVTLKGRRSGITQTVMAWLPPQYDDPAYARTRFPVVMVLGAVDVHIAYVVQRLNFAQVASEEIRSGRVAPFVAVFPEINVALPMDSECIDYPGSTQAFTWLDQDVTHWAASKLRVSRDSRRWSVMGWSTGGYCAAMLHLRDPGRFGTAASVEGYFRPEPDSTTGNLKQLLRHDHTLADRTSAAWWVEHRPPHPIQLLVMTSDKDPQSRPQSLEFLQAERTVPGIQPYLVPGLGHSLNAYHAVLAQILRWMTQVAHA